MYCDVPLTTEQRDFAEDNHELVYQFLQQNHFSFDEYYDIAVFGYLNAIYRYFSDAELQHYSFSTIAFQNMRRTCNGYIKATKRRGFLEEAIGIHDLYERNFLYIIPYNDFQTALMEQVEAKLLLHDLASKISEQQMKIVRMKASGYSLREIAQKQNTTIRAIKVLLEEVYLLLTQMCHDTE